MAKNVHIQLRNFEKPIKIHADKVKPSRKGKDQHYSILKEDKDNEDEEVGQFSIDAVAGWWIQDVAV